VGDDNVNAKAPLSIHSEDLLAVLAEAQALVKRRNGNGVPKKPKPKASKRPPVSLTDDELLKVLALATRRLRDWVLMLLTYRHGLRATEAISIRRRDLDCSHIRIRRGKDSEETEQPLYGHDNPLLNELEAVRLWLLEMGERGKKGAAKPGGRRSRAKILHSNQNVKFRTSGASERAGEVTGDDLLFPITRQRFFQIFRQYAIEAGLPRRKRSPHKLKHSIAKHLIREGVPINEVQDHLGWKSLKTADHYTRADSDEVAHSVDRAIRGKDTFRRMQQGDLFPKT